MRQEPQLWFGPFRVDPLDKRVWRGHDAVPLTPKAFDVLHELVQHSGRLVTKRELLDEVWRGVHVGDAVLKVCVREIRRALGDAAHAPRFVETVHGRGYRFIAPLQREASAASSPRAILIGRTAELERLHAALVRARCGHCQLVFVTGEPGIGKTSLVDAFLDEVSADHAITVSKGHCLEHAGAGEAYLPVLEALGRLCRAPGGERIVAILRKYAPTWFVQMPFLVTPPDQWDLTREILGTTRDRMLREITEALEALTAATPLILVLEDLHWSDHATGALLGWLVRSQGPGQLLLVGTYRPADVQARQHPLRVVIHDPRALHVEELALDLLSETAVVDFLEARFPGNRFPETLARLIYSRTEGNPLFMAAAVDFLVSRQTIVPAVGGWELRLAPTETEIGTPDTLRSMLEEQIDRLSPFDQRLLEVASVAGIEFTADAVATLGKIASARAEERCERLARRRQFLRSAGLSELPDGTVVSRYAFIHALYQQAFYQRVPGGRRARLHRQLGEYG